MNKLINQVVFSLILLCWSGLLNASDSSVGFNIHILDSKQLAPASDVVSRPIVLACWYPSKAKERLVTDYLTELRNITSSQLFETAYFKFIEGVTISESGVKNLVPAIPVHFDKVLGRSKNSRLVLYHPGLGGSLFDNSMLMEKLAAAGYLACSASFFPKNFYSFKINGELKTSLSDMDFIISYLRAANPEIETVGLIGHSFGAQAVLYTAIKRPVIRAVVMLDSTMDYPYSAKAFAGTEIIQTIDEEGGDLRTNIFAAATNKAEPKIFSNMAQSGVVWWMIPDMEHEDFTTNGYLLNKNDLKRSVEKKYFTLVQVISEFLQTALSGTYKFRYSISWISHELCLHEARTA